MWGYHPEYKPHLRIAAANELIRQIEFDYDEPTSQTTPVPSSAEPDTETAAAQSAGATEPIHTYDHAVAHDSKLTTMDTEITDHQPNSKPRI